MQALPHGSSKIQGIAYTPAKGKILGAPAPARPRLALFTFFEND